MNVLGIIAEYNPFHNGHLYHLNESRRKTEADFVVVVMSGDFVQRGEAAVLDKWTRSRLAVECGADLVLELPFVYACNSAEYFAKGSIGILSGLGCVTHLSFGSESGEIEDLKNLAVFLAWESEEFRQTLKSNIKAGMPFAKAREEAVRKELGSDAAALLTQPNNILAVEYLKQLERMEASIIPVAIKRKGAGYKQKEPEDGFASATAIRNNLLTGKETNQVPENVKGCLPERIDDKRFFDLVRNVVLRSDSVDLGGIFSASEGLENKLKKEIRKANSLEDLIDRVKSGRYPAATIKRLMCHILMDLRQWEDTCYGRLLAFNEKGAALLNHIKKSECAKIPIITNINKVESRPHQLNYDILASDTFNLIRGKDLYLNSDYVRHPEKR